MIVLLLALGLSGCADADGVADAPGADIEAPETMTVSSPSISEGKDVPVRFTCDGESTSPELEWSDVPDGAKSLALVVDDPDAPDGTFTHWVVLDIAPDATSSPEGAPPRSGVPAANSAGGDAYAGPCPPSGSHRYRFTVYALDAATDLVEGARLREALDAIGEHAIAYGRLTATYESTPEADDE